MKVADSERAALFAVSEGGPMAILFAAAHPERARALVFVNTYARITSCPDYPLGSRSISCVRLSTIWSRSGAPALPARMWRRIPQILSVAFRYPRVSIQGALEVGATVLAFFILPNRQKPKRTLGDAEPTDKRDSVRSPGVRWESEGRGGNPSKRPTWGALPSVEPPRLVRTRDWRARSQSSGPWGEGLSDPTADVTAGRYASRRTMSQPPISNAAAA
jgi:pimeloyl-ACP methyl ester carboxylesterase